MHTKTPQLAITFRATKTTLEVSWGAEVKFWASYFVKCTVLQLRMLFWVELR